MFCVIHDQCNQKVYVGAIMIAINDNLPKRIWGGKEKVFYILYLLLAAWLPESRRLKFAKVWRRF